MNKFDDKAYIKQVLADVISISMSHIQDLSLQLKKLDITPSNLSDKSAEDKERSIILNNILTIVNDAIHPAHQIAKEIYPGAKEFIDMCIVNHKLAIERKLISDKCGCYMCKTQSAI